MVKKSERHNSTGKRANNSKTPADKSGGKPAPSASDPAPKAKRGPRKNGKILATEKRKGAKSIIVTAKVRTKPKGKPRGRPFPKGHPHRFQIGNKAAAGPRPKELSEAYRVFLRSPVGENGETGAEVIAVSVAAEAADGNIAAATEIRKATEGDKLDIGGFAGMALDDIYRSMEAFLGGMSMEELGRIREMIERVYQARLQAGEGEVIENAPALPSPVPQAASLAA